jgi:hypothetical protein
MLNKVDSLLIGNIQFTKSLSESWKYPLGSTAHYFTKLNQLNNTTWLLICYVDTPMSNEERIAERVANKSCDQTET